MRDVETENGKQYVGKKLVFSCALQQQLQKNAENMTKTQRQILAKAITGDFLKRYGFLRHMGKALTYKMYWSTLCRSSALIYEHQRRKSVAALKKKIMAFRAKIFHIVILGIVGIIVIFYSSFFNGPILVYHIETDRNENITVNTTKDVPVSAKLKETNQPIPPESSVIQTIPLKTNNDNVTLDKTVQGIPTEHLYQSGYDIPNVDLCPSLGAKLKVVVGIMSAPSHQEARMAIRQTWGHYALRKDVALGFIVGMSKIASMNDITTEESTVYGDIIRGNFIDSYDNLTLKTISYLEWIDNYCSEAHYILKTDDDMFINFTKLLSFIDKHWKHERTIFGRLAKKWKPIRNRKSKYFVSPKQFSHSVFPDFTTGPAYLFTGDIVHDMYTNALKTTYLKLEDVFTTGIVAQSINVKRIHINEFINKRIPFNVCNIKKSISIHMIKFHEQFDLWKKLLDGRSKCK